jgi:hypothetical protein
MLPYSTHHISMLPNLRSSLRSSGFAMNSPTNGGACPAMLHDTPAPAA